MIFYQATTIIFSVTIALSSTFTHILTELVENNFKTCTVYIFYHKSKSEKKWPIEKLSYDSATFGHGGVYITQLNLNNPVNTRTILITNSTKIADKMDLHQHRDKCVAVFIFLEDDSETAFSNFYEELKTLTSYIKKDEDYFIFITDPGAVSSILLHRRISVGIKYKLVLSPTAFDSYEAHTACIFCDFGITTVIPIKLMENNGKMNTIKSRHQNFPDYVRNFHGRVMRVSVPTSTGWLNEIRQINGKWIGIRGVYNSTMNAIMAKYNFTCEYFPSAGGGGTGVRLSNGTWVGTVGDVMSYNSDLGQVTGQTWARNKVVGYTFPVTYEWLTFTTGEPLPYFSWRAVYWPLGNRIWIGAIISCFGSFVMFQFLFKATNQPANANETAVYLFGSLMEQDKQPPGVKKSSAVRVYVIFWLLFSMVILTAYRSKLVSFLVFPLKEVIPTTFEELEASKYKLGLQYLKGAAYQLFKTSTNPTYVKIFEKMELEPVDARCYERAIGTKFSCISWSAIADFVYQRNLSDKHGRVPLIKAPAMTCFLSVGIIMEQRAAFRTNFDLVVSRAVDNGIMIKWRTLDFEFIRSQRREWEKQINKTAVTYNTESSDSLTISHLTGSLLILCGGIITSLNFFAFEMYKGRNSRSQSTIISNY